MSKTMILLSTFRSDVEENIHVSQKLCTSLGHETKPDTKLATKVDSDNFDFNKLCQRHTWRIVMGHADGRDAGRFAESFTFEHLAGVAFRLILDAKYRQSP